MEKTGYVPPKAEKTEEQLEAELQERMSELDGDQEPDDNLETDEEPQNEDLADESDEDDPTPDEGDSADESDEDDPTPEDEDEADDDDDGSVDIPDAHYRAAIHQGWTEDEIRELVTLNPDKAKTTFAKFHETTNKITQEFARLGRASKEADEPGGGTEPDAKASIDIEALKEKHGDDNPLVGAVDQLQQELIAMRQERAEEKAAAAKQVVPADDTLNQVVDNFFSADNMKAYVDYYGPGNDHNKWTGEQYQQRHSMLITADEIILGARAQGRKLEPAEALEMAHMLHSANIKEEIIRKDIATTLEKRSKGLSLKPKSSKKVESSKPKTGADLEAVTAERMRKIMS
jgi:hypothetical protein